MTQQAAGHVADGDIGDFAVGDPLQANATRTDNLNRQEQGRQTGEGGAD
jgi:hypothetical protein